MMSENSIVLASSSPVPEALDRSKGLRCEASQESALPVCSFGEAESEPSMGGLTEQVNGSEICDNQTEWEQVGKELSLPVA